MTPRALTTSSVIVALVLGAQPVYAQGAWTGRVRASVDLGIQPDTVRLSQRLTLIKNVESAPISAELPPSGVRMFGGGVSIGLVGNLGAGLSFSTLSNKDDAAVTGTIPHPFFFNQPRSISGVTSVEHKEVATHLSGVYLIPSQRLDLALSAGVSFFDVEQDFLTDVRYVENYPYDTASFDAAVLVRGKASRKGYHVGADVAWKLGPRWGVGGLIRYSKATVPFQVNQTAVGTMEVGGVQAGAGLRVMF